MMQTRRFRLAAIRQLLPLAAVMLVALLPAARTGAAQARPGAGKAAAHVPAKPLGPGLYATFDTAKGKFVVQLFPDKAPKTVSNFVSLAKGEKPHLDPIMHMMSVSPLYDGLFFFRTIPGFIIQTGDPANTGTGDVGFTIPNEKNDLRFDRPGRLSMAQSEGDPNSRASQIFITCSAAPSLNREFLVFGQVVQGLAVVRAISEGPHRGDDRPARPVMLNHVTIQQIK
jgi:peptidyl-prolyl cis-trans isomerase A (cyclophilin A)